MENEDNLGPLEKILARNQREIDSLPRWQRKIYHDAAALASALIIISVFECFFFRNVFLRALFFAWQGQRLESRWLLGTLALTLFAEREVGTKLGLAALQSSADFAVELALMLLVFPLHFWRSPGQPVPDPRHVAAWDVLSSVASLVVGALDDYHGMSWWHKLARVNPAFLCRSAGPVSLYTTCSHYATLVFLFGRLNAMFHEHLNQVEDDGDEAPEAELTARRIWTYRAHFLFWALLARLSAIVSFELVADASGCLQCWYFQAGMKFLDWLPLNPRRLPFTVCVLGVHYLSRYRFISWVIDLMDMLVNPENHEDDDEDWDDEDLNDADLDHIDLDDVDLEQEDDDEYGDEHDEDDEEGEGPEDDAGSADSEETTGETDDGDEDEDVPDYVYIHQDDRGYVFELKDGDRFEREATYTYDGEHDYRYRYVDAFEKVSVRSRATDRGWRVSYRYARKDATGDEVRDLVHAAGEREDYGNVLVSSAESSESLEHRRGQGE
ncbi:hypothetical protein CGRA01v4_08917 [Colletotrichum graminicola]|uniref:Uncharacterized protein n=1 Tax=Colletotrichum graminicola (strain M1.001 / M2 / FGSC 10212) TaxID=645133 RepID=E3Q7H5_COLGM|nr:uncharacterized protein GLRG_02633 [Colletotrichum graminicola M1.001]EFQ26813.1 hypothetical protein GLRG_02633 [Colletotrichum graminicola M1.001]WDK17634.1 hypothetical protein CGRA01v4_08917 [Colletotrichum graminicola]